MKKRTPRKNFQSESRDFARRLQTAAEGTPRESLINEWAGRILNETELASGIVATDAIEEAANILPDVLVGNLALFALDPLDLRQRLFASSGDTNQDFPELLELLWQDAESFLEHNPIGEKTYAEEGDLLKPRSAFPIELSKAQEFAIEIFRCIREIQSFFATAKPIYEQKGPIRYNPIGFEGGWPSGARYDFSRMTDMKAFNKFFAEVLLLTRAVMNLDFHNYIWPIAKIHARSIQTSRSKRQDNLNKAIIQDLNAHGLNRTPEQILASLKKAATIVTNDSIIYEVYDNVIHWWDKRKNARETSFKSFRNRVSKIKASLHSSLKR